MKGITALIALDGTKLSETSLYTAPFLKALGVETLRLVAVWERIEGLGREHISFMEAQEKGQAAMGAYLANKAEALCECGMDVQTRVRFGDADDELLDEVDECGADIVVIATHGRVGRERWRLGSVADKVIRGTQTPILIVGPNVTVDMRTFMGRRVVVPLDGTREGEEALAVARTLHNKAGMRIDLVRVVSLPNTWAADPFYVMDPQELLQGLEEGAQAYLEGVATDLDCRRVVVSAMTTSAPDELARYAQSSGAGLILMTSHARHGAARWVLGSVADEMLRGPAPVLLVKPGTLAQSRLCSAEPAAVGSGT